MANYTLNYSGSEVDKLLEKIDTAFGETNDYILPATSFEWMDAEGMMMAQFPSLEMLVGETYVVNWGGIDYPVECMDGGDGNFFMGNLAMAGGDNTGEPFAIMSSNGDIFAADITGNAPNTVSIYGKCIRYLNYEYLSPIPEFDLTSLGVITTNGLMGSMDDITVLNNVVNRGVVRIKFNLDVVYTVNGDTYATDGEEYTCVANIERRGSGYHINAIFEGAVIIYIRIRDADSIDAVARVINFA